MVEGPSQEPDTRKLAWRPEAGAEEEISSTDLHRLAQISGEE
jgi:hypothetical protein